MKTNMAYTMRHLWFNILLAGVVFLVLTSCGPNGNNTNTLPTPTSTVVRVNGFGVAANHVHSLIALPNHVLILATHYGIFHSADGGTTWQQTAAGPNQPM